MDHLTTLCAESAAEEPWDEGADGPDEEPAVGRQRHADAQEMMTCFAIPKLRELPVYVLNVGPRPPGVPGLRHQKSPLFVKTQRLSPFYSLPCCQWGELAAVTFTEWPHILQL